MVESKTKESTSTKSQELKLFVDELEKRFTEFSNDAKSSSMMLELNIKDSLASFAEQAIENPLSTSFDFLTQAENGVKLWLRLFAETFLKGNKGKLKSVHLHKSDESLLHYSIIIKDDNITTRGQLFRFITDYESSKYYSRFPIVFQPIPLKLEAMFAEELKANDYEKIL